jgi:SAM-dependent methyltransferase
LSLPAELSPEKTERLHPPRPDASAAQEAAEAAPAVATPLPAPARSGRRLAVRVGKRVAHTVLGPEVSAKLRARITREPVRQALQRSDEALRRVGDLEQQLSSLQRRSLSVELVEVEARAATINLELLKGEVRSVVQALEDLGMAIAPATGLAGAGVRLSELRERVNGLDRRLRSLVAATPAPQSQQPAPGGAEAAAPTTPATTATATAPAATTAAPATATAVPAAATAAPAAATAVPAAATAVPAATAATAAASAAPAQSALFDYVGFERRFRGDPETVAAELSRRYLDLLAPNPPVLDIGCGNAGLVELLTGQGVEAIGIDTDPSMVAEARDRGLDVRLVDGLSFLRAREPGSLGAIIATHMVEHIEFGDLVELLELAATRLRPGGVFIAETPNPASLIVLGNSFIIDPTHLRPLHPSLLVFLCEGAGFRDVRLHFYAPAGDYHLPLIEDPEAPAWTAQVNEAFAKLNSVLFGPQEYAVIATAGAPDSEESARGPGAH